MDNTLQITNGKITLNGVPVHNISKYSLEPFYRDASVTEVKLVFNVDNISVGESIDQSPIHQPETKLDLVKLIRFAMEGVKLSKLQLKASDHARWTYKATREKELNDYKDELDREYSRLTNG